MGQGRVNGCIPNTDGFVATEGTMAAQANLQRIMLLAVAAVAAGLVGCATFQDKPLPKLTAEVTAGPQATPAAEAKYIVEVHSERGKLQAVEKPLTEPTHVQAALDKTGAAKKFGRFTLDLLRPLPSGGWHKMHLEVDHDTKRIPPEFDYAVMPGDRIMVTEDPSNILDDVMNVALRPLGVASPAQRKKQEAAKKYQIRG